MCMKYKKVLSLLEVDPLFIADIGYCLGPNIFFAQSFGSSS